MVWNLLTYGWIALIASTVMVAMVLGRFAALSLLAGGLWNLCSLLCLTQLLHAWIGPRASTRRAIAWLLVKFPLLYAAIFLLIQRSIVSIGWFGAGFTVVLAAVAVFFIRKMPQLSLDQPQGR